MKRKLSLLLAFVMLVSLSAACGKTETVVDDPYADISSTVSVSNNVDRPTTEVKDSTVEAENTEAAADTENTTETPNSSEGASEPSDAEQNEEEPVASESVPAEESEPVMTNPLTGEVTDIDYGALRPYAVMIDNVYEALPQDGISYADILYEAAAYAGGTPRCMGIFLDVSGVEKIGGVRSARSQFVDLAMAYDALYVSYGGSDEGIARIRKIGCTHIDGMGSPWLYRDSWREANIGYTHAVVLDTKMMLDEIEDSDYRIKHEDGYSYGLTFAPQEDLTAGAENAGSVEINIGGNKSTFFEYDEENGVYLASQYDEPWIDNANGEQLSFTNLLLIYMEGRTSGNYQLHETVGEGKGYHLVNGKATEIIWRRDSVNDPYQYFTLDGTPLVLGVGKTYIGVCTCDGYILFE